jgi:hypothetical protein
MGESSDESKEHMTDAELRAAEALSVQIFAALGERPLSRAWRVEGSEGQSAALVVVRDDAPQAERERFGAAAERLQKLGSLPGLLHVRSVSPSRNAFVADLVTTGTAKDLGVFEWSVRRRLEFVKEVAQALDTLHKQGTAHGCLCEENVLLSDDLKPVLAEAGSVSVHALVERGGDAASYVAFAAPEVLEGAEAGPRSDVYALGRLIQHVLRSDDVPPSVAAIVRRCLAPAPAGRYASAADLVAAVEAAAGDLPREVPVAAAASPAVAREPSERKAEPLLVPEAVRAAPGVPGVQARWPAPAGTAMVALSITGAFLGGGASTTLRYLLLGSLVVGVALLAWTLRPQKQTPTALRVAFALAFGALVIGTNPLEFADRSSAARTIAHGSPDARHAAIAEIVELGRDFRGMSLAGADLSGLDLRGADLRYADLSRADLSGTNLSGATLTGTSLDGATLSGTDLRQGDLGHAVRVETAACNAKTLMPEPWRCTGGHPKEEPKNDKTRGAPAPPAP